MPNNTKITFYYDDNVLIKFSSIQNAHQESKSQFSNTALVIHSSRSNYRFFMLKGTLKNTYSADNKWKFCRQVAGKLLSGLSALGEHRPHCPLVLWLTSYRLLYDPLEKNLFRPFQVILLTDRQTERQTWAVTWPPPLGEVITDTTARTWQHTENH